MQHLIEYFENASDRKMVYIGFISSAQLKDGGILKRLKDLRDSLSVRDVDVLIMLKDENDSLNLDLLRSTVIKKIH